MNVPKSLDGADDQNSSTHEQVSSPPAKPERLPWSSPTLTDFGAVNAVTEGISYTPNDGLSNRCI